MRYATIGQGETPECLSARLGRPVCMLLRANRLFSAQWLMDGRRIIVPDGDFCRRDAGICPLEALHIHAERFSAMEPEWAMHLPDRLRRWSNTHGGAALTEWRRGMVMTIRPGESMSRFSERMGCDESEIRRVNRYYGKGVPGVQLWIPFRNGEKRV